MPTPLIAVRKVSLLRLQQSLFDYDVFGPFPPSYDLPYVRRTTSNQEPPRTPNKATILRVVRVTYRVVAAYTEEMEAEMETLTEAVLEAMEPALDLSLYGWQIMPGRTGQMDEVVDDSIEFGPQGEELNAVDITWRFEIK